jgi:glutaredoxin
VHPPLATLERQPVAPLAALEPAEIDAGLAVTGAAPDSRRALLRAMALEKIVMYSRPSDPECGALRSWMLSHGHLFVEKDVDADGEARSAWAKVARTVPALDIDGTVVVGFEPARIEAAIEYAGARRVQPGP